MDLELEPGVEEWLDEVRPAQFATVAFPLDRLVDSGPRLRMPHSRALGEGLFELRFDLDRQARRITYFFPVSNASCCSRSSTSERRSSGPGRR